MSNISIRVILLFYHVILKMKRSSDPVGSDAKRRRRAKSRTIGTQTDLSKQVAVLRRQMRGMHEVNTKDVEVSATAVSDTGLITSLALISQGDGRNERVGNKVTLKSVQIRGRWVSADSPQAVRLLIIKASNSASTAPTIGTLFTDTSDPVFSPFNPDWRKHYDILYDQTWNLHTYEPSALFSVGIWKFKDKKITFQADGTTADGQLYTVACSDSASVSHPTIYFQSRVRYYDN